MPKTKKGTRFVDWSPKVYKKCLWQRGRMWRKSDEAAYFAYFKREIEEVAIRMVHDYRLPESNLADLISDGMLALAKVPAANRWSGKYVYQCVVNRMRDGLQQARTRWSRYELVSPEMWTSLSDTRPAKDGIDGRIEIRQFVSMLGGAEADVVELHLAGYEAKEIAARLSMDPAAVKSAWDAAVARIRERINPKEQP